MLSVWWNMKGVIHWELLPENTTVTAEVYCQQLDRVAAKLQGKQDRVFFLHDNARPHVARSSRQKLMEFAWTVLPHAPYSPDLAPTDYHLFRSLANFLDKKIFANDDELKEHLGQFFNQKSEEFYKRGIMSLPDRWRKVADNNGLYIDEI